MNVLDYSWMIGVKICALVGITIDIDAEKSAKVIIEGSERVRLLSQEDNLNILGNKNHNKFYFRSWLKLVMLSM